MHSQMTASTFPKSQILTENGELNPNIKLAIHDFQMNNVGREYNIVGVIGCQSSGKSTLLNYVFGTQFDTMDSSQFRKQTTKGIWMSRDVIKPLLVLDIEGSDSKERWEDRHGFERSTALFGLVICNIFIVNIWVQEIGRFTASNYEIIKVIFELNVKLFNQDSIKKIVFVLRDYNPQENFDYISNTIKSDINRIWTEVKKPPHLATFSSDQFFDIDIYPLQHFRYEKERFAEGCKKFRDRFIDPQNPYYYFRGFNYKTNIPCDGLGIFIEKIWMTIKDNKELNLPSQKIMVSNFRCTEIKKEAIGQVEDKLKEFRDASKTKIIENLGKELKSAIEIAAHYYEENAQDYLPDIALEKKEEMHRELFQQAEEIRRNNLEKAEKILLEEFSSKLNVIKKEKEFRPAMRACCTLCDNQIIEYSKFLESTMFKPNEESDQSFKDKFNILIQGLLIEFLNSRISTFTKTLHQQKQKDLDTMLNRIFSSLNSNFWAEIVEFYTRGMIFYDKEFNEFKNDFSELNKIITEDYIIQIKYEFHYSMETSLNQKAKNLNRFLIDKFRKTFERSNGVKRNWAMIKDEDIQNIFREVKNECLESLENFKEKGLPTFSPTPQPSFNPEDGTAILSKDELEKVKQRFEDQINDELDRVYQRKQNNSGLDKVPKWLWIILLYFMHDNILEWIRHPVVFFIILILVGSMGYLYATGKTYMVIGVLKQFYGLGKGLLQAKGILPKDEIEMSKKNA